MAGEGTKRIIDLTEAAETQSGDYIAIDSTGRGTRKLPAGFMATAEDLSEEQTARQTADATLDGKITAEAQARLDADNALGEQITALDEKTEADAALIQNPTKTLSGALCSFTDGANMPMVACTASIVPKQSGTGTPSPDNVRPISGWESVVTSVTGVNVWDEEWEQGGIETSAGAETSTAGYYRSKNYTPIIPQADYFLVAPTNMSVFFYDSDKHYIRYVYTTTNTTFTAPSEARYFRFRNAVANTWTPYNNDISINYPSTDTDYHAYNGTTTTTDLGRTVYGGTLDVVSGVLTVDRAMVTLDGTQEISLTNWRATSAGVGWVYPYSLTNNKVERSDANMPKLVCDSLPTITYGTAFQGTSVGVTTLATAETTSSYGLVVRTADTSLTTASAINAYLSAHPITVCYELATPQTYTLTPTEVKTLLGENNVWADAGAVEVTYRRDISIVINNLEAALNG